MEYSEWLNVWLDNYVKPSAKERTFIRYEQLIRTHVAAKIGDKDVDALTPIVLQSFVMELLCSGNEKTGGGLSANTVNVIISVIRNSLRTARLIGVTGEYAANGIKRPKRNERVIDCFTLAEQKKIESAVAAGKKQKMFGVVLCLYTGLRVGELIALRWQDVDLKKGLISVNRSCHDASGGIVFDDPKTATSRREIPIPRQLIKNLKNIKKSGDSDFVVSANGNVVSVRSYQRSFELLLKKLNIRHRGFHSLRHTFATRALECGMDVRTLSEILGHRNPTVTLNRYAHSLIEHKTAMMNRLGKLFSSSE